MRNLKWSLAVLHVSVWVACLFVAAADEFHQTFVASRGALIGDIMIDSGGAILGGDLTARQKDELDRYENQIVSLTGWLVLAYAGPPETTNCGSANFHDWHLEIFENPSDHAPQVGDPTPIICEITPRTEQRIVRDGVQLQSLAGFFRLPDVTYQATGHDACKVRVTGYLLWDDDHSGSADVGSTIENFSNNGFHHPWRSTAWEVHPGHEDRGDRMKYWEIIADNLSKAGWSWGCVATVDRRGRTIFIADARKLGDQLFFAWCAQADPRFAVLMRKIGFTEP